MELAPWFNPSAETIKQELEFDHDNPLSDSESNFDHTFVHFCVLLTLSALWVCFQRMYVATSNHIHAMQSALFEIGAQKLTVKLPIS